ncbi:hypothetical protein Scep_023852 [Stephania cephalantha]|uniref:Small ribosomal subunit protein uS15c n=1 Tax=Stephania cephalantha TaxID=152367 RepID=A0AAP0HWM2_9MAGN
MALQLRLKCKPYPNPILILHFSSSSSSSSSPDSPPPSPPNPNDEEDKNESRSQSQFSPSQKTLFSSYFSDIRASLKQPPSQRPRGPSSPPPPPSETPSFAFSRSTSATSVASIEEIRKNLSEFRRRPAEKPSPSTSSSSQPILFQDLYKRNVIEKSEGGAAAAAGGSGTESAGTGVNQRIKLDFDSIRESLRQFRVSDSNQSASDRIRGGGGRWRGGTLDPYSLKSFQDNLKMKPDNQEAKKPSLQWGGTEAIRRPVLGKELKPELEPESKEVTTEFMKSYGYKELGSKLLQLRPADAKGFSLDELNERLKKLKQSEEKELDARVAGIYFKDLRESLVKLNDNKTTKPIQRFDILSHLQTPNYMLSPPKEHLVEKYFHPDTMSSKEKMKLELQRVRDEFKMSETDCGSSRVQVAQLTTKIKHLSSVLAKKDKHSRKGLLAMVQRRKKLLKYLRRTDWDSYCMVISRLGLRDNPDYKEKKKKQKLA